MNTAQKSPNTLTFLDFQEMIDKYFPVLYYGLDKEVERGSIYICKETAHNPEFIILHPDDLDDARKKITARRLVHLSLEPQEKILERLQKNLHVGAHLEMYGTKGV
jgi:hypothetical protein